MGVLLPPFGYLQRAARRHEGHSIVFLFVYQWPGPASLATTATSLEEEEENKIEGLAKFHLGELQSRTLKPRSLERDRLRHVQDRPVPHLRELRAIKVAIAEHYADLPPRFPPSPPSRN